MNGINLYVYCGDRFSSSQNINKLEPTNNNIITRIGGPAYRIGLGGGSASSYSNNENNNNTSAVQRGDAGMENKVVRAVRNLSGATGENIILSIHDQVPVEWQM